MTTIHVCCNCGEECTLCTVDLSPEHSKTETVSRCCYGWTYEEDLETYEESLNGPVQDA